MKKSEEMVMWVRLPKPMTVDEMRKLGVGGSACYGGDTCIAATTAATANGVVVQNTNVNSLGTYGLKPADCYGGDTCIA